jgi:hypothetical protein
MSAQEPADCERYIMAARHEFGQNSQIMINCLDAVSGGVNFDWSGPISR